MSKTQKAKADNAIDDIHEILCLLDESFHADEEYRGGYSKSCLIGNIVSLRDKADILEYIINNHYEEDEMFRTKE